jgi:murein tripeptide amidase MpaA
VVSTSNGRGRPDMWQDNMSDFDDLKSRAELSNYQETTSYADVVRFITEVETRSNGLMRVEFFGQTEEGRNMPVMVFGESAPDKPVIFVMANIHAGEVEGKEAMLHMSRRLVSGDLRPLLDNLFLLIAPIYNADGNERISPENRSEQYGPVGGVGTRENANGLDLNRDYMKVESAEARALVGLFNRWNPHLTVDLHTTNGSYHGYHLTFSPTLNPNTDPNIITYERESILPTVLNRLREQHGYRTYFYGNFATLEAMNEELSEFANSGTEVWRTFDHRPRFGNNYVGLRNRLTILSEAYSYVDFQTRIAVTSAFVEEILKYASAHAEEILSLLQDIDPPQQMGVEFELESVGEREILTCAVEKKENPRSGNHMLAVVENALGAAKMQDYGVFRATRKIPMPAAYLVEAGIAGKLVTHGVVITELLESRTLDVEKFVITERQTEEQMFQGHHEVRLKGHTVVERITVPAGTLLVKTSQPLGRLVFYLLDPESDDGFVTWGLLEGDRVYRVPGREATI